MEAITVEAGVALIKESLSLWILLPIVWYFIKKNNEINERMLDKFNEWINNIVQSIDKIEKWYEKSLESIHLAIRTHADEENRILANLSLANWKSSLSSKQTVDILLMYMWSVSQTKLDFIRNILEENHIYERSDFVKEKIRNELIAQSNVYMEKFSEFNTPVWDLSTWIDKNFNDSDFEKFIKKIYDIVFKKYDHVNDPEKVVTMKVAEVRDLMKGLQNMLWRKLKKDLWM